MVKQTFSAPKTQDGQDISLRNDPNVSGGGRQFSLISPDFYVAIMTSMDESVFQSKDGKATYLKVQPEFVLLNDNNTLLNRQDLTVGYYKPATKELYHPDDGKYPIWGGGNGALFLFKALGLFRETEDGKYDFDLNTKIVKDRVVKVRTGIAGYVKGNTTLSLTVNNAENFNKMAVKAMQSMTGGQVKVWGMEDIPQIVEWFNSENGLDAENGLKTKNVIVGFYNVSKIDIEKHGDGWYVDDETGAVFTTKAGYEWFMNAEEEQPADGNSNDW